MASPSSKLPRLELLPPSAEAKVQSEYLDRTYTKFVPLRLKVSNESLYNNGVRRHDLSAQLHLTIPNLQVCDANDVVVSKQIHSYYQIDSEIVPLKLAMRTDRSVITGVAILTICNGTDRLDKQVKTNAFRITLGELRNPQIDWIFEKNEFQISETDAD